MLKPLLYTVILLACCAGAATAQVAIAPAKKITERYYQLIEAPTSPTNWDAWRLALRTWKDSVLASVRYTGENYHKAEYRWASSAYATFFLMANDNSLYDAKGNYAIRNCLKQYEENYGGVDVVVLWPTYPQLGFDGRNQYEFYRNMPGGVAALKQVSHELHRMGKKLMIAYNPWDDIARKQGKKDEDELLNLLKEVDADGVYLDTISIVDGFFDDLQAAKKGAIFQSEIPTSPDLLNFVHQSWLEVGWNENYKNLEFAEVPVVVRNRWLEQRHTIYRLARFSHEQSTLIQNAWVNGCGLVIWENVFGTVNPLNPRDRSLYNAMLPVLRQYTTFFTEGTWTPLFPVKLNRVYASQWQLGTQKIWTIINRQEQLATGKLFDEAYVPGTKYIDLITGQAVRTKVENGRVSLYAELKPKAIAGILSVTEAEFTPELRQFLSQQAVRHRQADFSTTYTLPVHQLRPVAATKKVSKTKLPAGMVAIPVSPDSVTMRYTFRQRECGFYPLDGFVDYSYSQARNEITVGRVRAKLTPFAVDETLVTNAQFAQFLTATHYKPVHPENFLKHWVNNSPPKGQENHPVVYITPDDARAYANWQGKRLPTEAEWQWSAQNGTNETPYPWGSQPDSTLCNSGQTAGTTPVMQFAKGRTKQGLYDMSGNVWQLTESERTDGANTYCVLRGGAWYRHAPSEWYADQGAQKTSFGAKYLLTSPGLDRCATVGFRCVVDTD